MRLPWPVQRATAAAAPYSMSSGWATTKSAVCQSSGSASKVGGVGEVFDMGRAWHPSGRDVCPESPRRALTGLVSGHHADGLGCEAREDLGDRDAEATRDHL